MFIIQATVITIVNYNHKMFIVEATDVNKSVSGRSFKGQLNFTEDYSDELRAGATTSVLSTYDRMTDLACTIKIF
jgi:hypothetical protein